MNDAEKVANYAKDFDVFVNSLYGPDGQQNKILILNSPNNPSGAICHNLKELAKVAKKNNLIILSDEIYTDLSFDNSYKSISKFYPESIHDEFDESVSLIEDTEFKSKIYGAATKAVGPSPFNRPNFLLFAFHSSRYFSFFRRYRFCIVKG